MVRPPSRIDDTIAIPIFGLAWHGDPAPLASSSPSDKNNDGCSILAYCGGGGSARTGVNNSIVVTVTTRPSDGSSEHRESLAEEAGRALRRTVRIDTKNDVPLAVQLFRCFNDPSAKVKKTPPIYLLAALGDEIRLYAIPIDERLDEFLDKKKDCSSLVAASVNVGKGYGCNAIAFAPTGNFIAVGCENGTVVICCVTPSLFSPPAPMTAEIQKLIECRGHEKAVCCVRFHPRSRAVLSSAKDGTARVWDVGTGRCLDVLACSIDDPQQPPAPKPPKRSKPKQILVRGCVYGDLEGKIIYTVASGRKGSAVLSGWKAKPPNVPAGKKGPPPSQPGAKYAEQVRRVISPVPISAMSLSGDASLIALGGVDGNVTLLSTETFTPVKVFDAVHDLPVTAIASRPMPLPFPGEAMDDGGDGAGIAVDVVSASADNKMAHLTLQRKVPRKKRDKSARGGGANSGTASLFSVSMLMIYLLFFFLYVVGDETWTKCRREIETRDFMGVKGCLWNQVLWAPADFPGVSSIPH